MTKDLIILHTIHLLFFLFGNLLAQEGTYPLDKGIKAYAYGFPTYLEPREGWGVSLLDPDPKDAIFSSNKRFKIRYEDLTDDKPNTYQIYFVDEQDWYQFTLGQSFDLFELNNSKPVLNFPCPETFSKSPQAPKVSLRPLARPPQSDFWLAPNDDPYLTTMLKRNLFLNQENCVGELWDFGEQLLKESKWSDTTVEDRAHLIYSLSSSILTDIRKKATATGKNKPYNSKAALKIQTYQNYKNPLYIDPMISPELMSCISFQESRGGGKLNPFVYNHTFCEEPQRSTAFGIGGITESTIAGMLDHSDGNLMPWLSSNTTFLRSKKSFREVHQSLMLDPAFQLEALIYILNEKIKYIRKNNIGASEDEIFLLSIAFYDQDKKKEYVRAVSSCTGCLKEDSNPYECYQKEIFSE